MVPAMIPESSRSSQHIAHDSVSIVASAEALAAHPSDRIDRWLARCLEDRETDPPLSRNRLKTLILDGRLFVNGATITDPSSPVKPGATYRIDVPEATPAIPEAQDLPLTVVYEDAALIVIDKPAGMTVHPAPGAPKDTLVNALIAHCGDSLSGIGGVKRPGIVHRIDKDTSGLLVVAKTDAAHHALAARFADHSIDRAYRALCWGRPIPPAGRIEGAIGRHPRDRIRMAVRPEGSGKAAVTHFRTVRAFNEAATLLECRLETGRTHQIRVHLTHIGHPLVGDPVYGRGRSAKLGGLPEETRDRLHGFSRQALHAAVLGFNHPITGEPLRFESPLPEDLAALIDDLDRVI
ncbi:Pseudouridylate synthase, 23S RNA-specific [alpha proteobacterium BAL199]|jgi:23S rRNA pseudouridine1911/1915/1917 synthase|nr:Pseudouridylate synthase, 23S RNA-specific [alpha proteobacterium BAL199]